MRSEYRNLKGGARVAALVLAAAVLLTATPALAKEASCPGQRSATPTITRLGVSHPFTQPVQDLADLQQRLPGIEADLRAVMSQAGLDQATADAVIAAIASGEGVTEETIPAGQKTPLQWMAYRCGGNPMLITTPTLKPNRKQKVLRLLVQVPDPPVPVDPGKCEIRVDRDCAHESPSITVDVGGSHNDPQVVMAAEDGAATPVPGEGSKWSIADPAPYSHDYSFTVTATGTPQPERFARVFDLILPEVCGNLSLVQELDKVKMADPGPLPTCTESTKVAMCDPWCEATVDPEAIEVHHETQVGMNGGWDDSRASLAVSGPPHSAPLSVEQPPYSASYKPLVPSAGCTDPYQVKCHAENAAGKVAEATAELSVRPHPWVFRPFLFWADPTGSDQSGSVTDGDLVGTQKFSVESGFGGGVALERKFNPVVGLEGALLLGEMNTKYSLAAGSANGSAEHNANFHAVTLGPNFHLLKCTTVDLYLGPFIGWGGLADPNYWVDGHHFHADLTSKFLWGGTLGLDVPFDPTKDVGFHAGLRYLKFDEKSDMGKFDVDPLVFEAGLSIKF